MRLGIDVGGTHTDAVLLDGLDIISTHKALTSSDVKQGIIESLESVLTAGQIDVAAIEAVMIGTTQFTNAVIQRRNLSPTALIRASLPTGSGVPPLCDWPADILAAVGDYRYLIGGGHLFNGKPIAELDQQALQRAIADIASKGIRSVAVAAAFSPAVAEHEKRMAEAVSKQIDGATVTMSHEIGRLGLLERENAAVLNAALGDLARRVVSNMQRALTERQIVCPFYVSQNDGTLMAAETVADYPALTFSSGPTNSIRGAAMLSGMSDAMVVDVGGTTADVGVLADGYPRESNSHIDVGGVRTNFRMPDILPVGLGGGSLVESDGHSIGPDSVGHRLPVEGLVFGGITLTATDIAVANGSCELGDKERVAQLAPELVETATCRMHEIIDAAVDRMRPSANPVPVILVGGGAMLVSRPLPTASQLIRPEHADIANALGAALAQAGGEVEYLVSYSRIDRNEALARAIRQARQKAIAAGAEAATLRVLEVEETAISYMDDAAARLRVKVVGDLRRAS